MKKLKNASSENRSVVYEIITNHVIDQLQKGVIPWRQPWDAKNCGPRNLVSKKPYHGFNAMMLNCLGFSSPFFLTMKQCNELGGSVKKGAASIPVTFWSVRYQNPDGSWSDGKKLSVVERATARKAFLLRYYKVWNVSQCENIQHLVPAATPAVDFTDASIAAQIVRNYPNPPKIKFGNSEAWYSPAVDLVAMPDQHTFINTAYFYQTFFHELVHSTGHQSRLNRSGIADHSARFGDPVYSFEELVAELGASFLCSEAGLLDCNQMDNSTSYINSWIKKLQSDPNLIIQASSLATKAVAYIQQAPEVALAA